jgi:hypothetical protein
MKFKAEDGTEWEGCDTSYEDYKIQWIPIKRIPEKSELEKWIEEIGANRVKYNIDCPSTEKCLVGGFRKAIEVAERACHSEPRICGLQAMGQQRIYNALKAYCGDK